MNASGDPRRPHLPALTSVRTFAALAVVLFHYAGLVGLPGPFATIARNGYVGVSFFFVLSGFVLTYNYADADLLARGQRRRFWQARFARIYPAYLLALALSLPIFLASDATTGISDGFAIAGQIALEATMLHAWTPITACGVNCPGWSLSVEAFFYAVFPLVIIPLARLRPRAAVALGSYLWLIALAAPVVYLLLPPSLERNVGSAPLLFYTTIYNPLLHLPQFLIGAAAAIVFLAHGGKCVRHTPVLAGAAGVFLLVVLSAAQPPYPLLNNGVLAPLFALLIYALADNENRASRLLAARPLLVLGEASYSVYILQHPVAYGFAWASSGEWPPRFASGATLSAFLVCLIAISIATFYLIETPARRRLRSRPERNPPTVLAG